MESISRSDRQILRALASKQHEIAASPQMQALCQLWIAHNDGQASRPLVVIEWETFAQEAIAPLLHCTGEQARQVEWALYANFVGHELFHDDSFVNDFMPVTRTLRFTPFGIEPQLSHAKDSSSIAYHYHEIITDLEDDFSLLGKATFEVDETESNQQLALYNELFGDILPAKLFGSGLYAVPTQILVHLMSMETMLFSMMDYPQRFHEMMNRLADDYLTYFHFLQEHHFLLPTTRNEHVGNGTFAFTNELPAAEQLGGRPVTLHDIWGFMDSQETTGISPEMYHEFIFPYYQKISAPFGLLSYGCCEAVDPIWDRDLSTLSNLRKVSISPWCNEQIMGERLAGKKIIYHRKPSPNYLGVDRVLDTEGFRKHIQTTLQAARGCLVEFTQRDVYTVHGDMEKVREYVRIVRQCIDERPV